MLTKFQMISVFYIKLIMLEAVFFSSDSLYVSKFKTVKIKFI